VLSAHSSLPNLLRYNDGFLLLQHCEIDVFFIFSLHLLNLSALLSPKTNEILRLMLYSWAHTTTGPQTKMSRCQTMLGEICMNAFQVTCPGCGTILKLPAGFSAGKIKCPKCAKVLALQNPSPSPAPQQPVSQASPQANQSDGASPFDSLPAFGSPSSGQPGIGLPASQPPAQLPPMQQHSTSPKQVTQGMQRSPNSASHRKARL